MGVASVLELVFKKLEPMGEVYGWVSGSYRVLSPGKIAEDEHSLVKGKL